MFSEGLAGGFRQLPVRVALIALGGSSLLVLAIRV